MNLFLCEYHTIPQGYTSASLKGLAVAHDVDDLESGRDIVLTLKDQGAVLCCIVYEILEYNFPLGVLGDDEDVLQNVDMIDDEKV